MDKSGLRYRRDGHLYKVHTLTKYPALKQNNKITLPPLEGEKSASLLTSDIKPPPRTVQKDVHSKHPPKFLSVLFADSGLPISDRPKTRGRNTRKSQDNTGKASEHQMQCPKTKICRATQQIIPEFFESRDLKNVNPKSWSSSKLPAINFSVYKLLRKKMFEERNKTESSFGQPVFPTGQLQQKSSAVKINVSRKSNQLNFWRNPKYVMKRELFDPEFTQTDHNKNDLKYVSRYDGKRISTPIPKLKHDYSESRFLLRNEKDKEHLIEAKSLQRVSARRKRIRRQAKNHLSKTLNQFQLPEIQAGRRESFESRLNTPSYTPASSVLSNFRYFHKMKSLVSDGSHDDASKIASFLERTHVIEAQLRRKKLENLRKYFLKHEAHNDNLETGGGICRRASETNKNVLLPKDRTPLSEISDCPVKFYQTFRKERANDQFKLIQIKTPQWEKRRQSTASSTKSDVPMVGLCKVVFRVKDKKGVMVIVGEEVNEAIAV